MVSATAVVDSELIKNLGETVRSGDDGATESQTASALGNSKFIGVYFGAHWAPPCRKFTHSLKKNYEEANKDGKQLEIVFCSQDGNMEAF